MFFVLQYCNALPNDHDLKCFCHGTDVAIDKQILDSQEVQILGDAKFSNF